MKNIYKAKQIALCISYKIKDTRQCIFAIIVKLNSSVKLIKVVNLTKIVKLIKQ
jgi:hypothetical protein